MAPFAANILCLLWGVGVVERTGHRIECNGDGGSDTSAVPFEDDIGLSFLLVNQIHKYIRRDATDLGKL